VAPREGTAFVLAAATFFVGSAVLTRSGEPGASTPLPWMLSHVFWMVATAFVAIGTVRLVRNHSASGTGTAGYVASGLAGLGVLHTLQWATWVYVDVIVYRQGAHELLSAPLLHPFGTGHMLMFAVIIGSVITALAWTLASTESTHRAIAWLGGLIGVLTVVAGVASLVTFAPVRAPTSLTAIVAQALSFAWVFVLGAALSRGRSTPERRRGA
jgi:hypothetical protein